ncbi:MAG: YceI family protein [Bdellovibrionaceae bacterium]|nr:YceI family protein [Pseudobdellovibrionaceae bacterium]
MATAFAEDKKKSAKKEAKPKAETLTIDTEASTIEWVGSKKMGDKHNGKIKLKDGKVEMKKGKVTGGNFTVDMATLSNDDLKDKPEYQGKLVTHLKSDDFFKVDQHPTSEFKITSVKEKDGKSIITGKLTMLGKTETLEFPAKIEDKDGVVTATGKVEVDRTKWGLTYGAGNIFKELTADKIINNNFELNFNLATKK